MKFPPKIEITEVGPRDGFQNIKEWIPTETKLKIIDWLITCGLKKIEATSFVNPKAVPQMADAAEVITTLKQKYSDVTFTALAPNLRGVRSAIEAGADEVAYIISASERHNFENTKQTIDQSLEGLGEVVKIAGGTKIMLAIPTTFNCPWTGKVPVENVIKIIEYGLAVGVSEIGLGDTIGSANPLQVEELLDILKLKFPLLSPVLHFHDTRGMGLANVIAAMQAGATKFETSVGGLGGCPFAPGASGNIATEDLVNMLEGMTIQTGIDIEKLMKAVSRTKEVLSVPIISHMASALDCVV
ncbi:MAG: Pyruvate carboxyltransferase [Clostridiales bacterium 38_11]|nr:MAG: Pyruvate carboxyltransferase [Clostridiales bacterium 38_11]